MNRKLLLASGGCAILAAILLMVVQNRRAHADQDEEDEESQQAAHRPSWVSVQNGQTVLTLDAATRSRAQISLGRLEATPGRQQLTAPAVVLSVQDLVSRRNAMLAGRTRIEKAEASLAVSRQEYERLQRLYQDNQNASEKAVQAAEGVFATDHAELKAAQQELELQNAAARQEWGEVVAGWVRDGSTALGPLFGRSDLLVQVTLPAGEERAAAHQISLEIPGGKLVPADLISPYPHVDPRVQGPSFLYEVHAYDGLAPGANLVARLPAGPSAEGVVVPESAVVWWQGGAWIYQQISPDHFARRAIPTDTPLDDGYFVAKSFAPGYQIVLKGAEWLLSEELRYQGQPEGED